MWLTRLVNRVKYFCNTSLIPAVGYFKHKVISIIYHFSSHLSSSASLAEHKACREAGGGLCVVHVWSDFRSDPVSRAHAGLTALKASSVSHLPGVLRLQHLNEPIVKYHRKLSGPLRNITVWWSPWKHHSCFTVFVITRILQVSATPLESRGPPTTSALTLVGSCPRPLLSPQLPKERPPLIYYLSI